VSQQSAAASAAPERKVSESGAPSKSEPSELSSSKLNDVNARRAAEIKIVVEKLELELKECKTREMNTPGVSS
jgi:hypothetical protein